jgi:glycosyltransferase involved in cell wall biosynthesis
MRVEKKLRVLHQLLYIGQRSGGLGPIALGLCKEQLKLGVDASVWNLDSHARTESGWDSSLDGAVRSFKVLGPSLIGFSPAMEASITGSEGDHFDVIHQHGIWCANSRVTNRWRKVYRRPTVLNPQGTLESYTLQLSRRKKYLAYLLYERQNLCHAACLQATCLAELASFRAFGLRNPIAVIPNGVPNGWTLTAGNALQFREKYALPPDRRIVLFVSRLHPKKGLPLLIQAISNGRRHFSDWIFVIAGPDEVGHKNELIEQIRSTDTSELIYFTGPVWAEDKRNAFAAADLFVLPTHSDNFAIAVTEALGAGLPVITTYGAPWPELKDYDCGWWVPVDAAAIQDALIDAVNRPSGVLVAMGERGRALVKERYTWERIAEKTLELYRWLLYGGNSPDFVFRD